MASGGRVAAIEHKVLVRAVPRKVFDAIATSAGLDAWWTTGALVDPSQKVFRLEWRAWGPEAVDLVDDARLSAWEPPTLLAFDWHPHGDERVSSVEIRLAACRGGTLVTLLDSGPSFLEPSAMAAVAAGWGEALTLLKFYVEHGLTYDGR